MFLPFNLQSSLRPDLPGSRNHDFQPLCDQCRQIDVIWQHRSTCAVPAGRPAGPVGSVSRSGLLLDAEALVTGIPHKGATSATPSRKGRPGNAPAAAAAYTPYGLEVLDSSHAAVCKAPRICKGTQPVESQQGLHTEAGFLQSQQQQQQQLGMQLGMQLDEHNSAVADQRLSDQAHSRDNINRANAGLSTLSSQPSVPFAAEPLVRLPHHKSLLETAASMYAASGVVDSLFAPRNTYLNGDAAPMTKARHHFGMSSEQVAADIKKQKEFASGLAAWYKTQLKRHAQHNAAGGRALSRSNSSNSE